MCEHPKPPTKLFKLICLAKTIIDEQYQYNISNVNFFPLNYRANLYDHQLKRNRQKIKNLLEWFSKRRFCVSSIKMSAWAVWVIASIFFAYQYILRVMPNILLDDIIQQFDFGGTALGQFSGVYYIGYSLMHLPIGIMLDRYGPRKIMTACILLTVVGLFPLIFADHWAYPIAGRLLIGIGSSAAILGVFKIIRMTFSQEHFSRMLSFSVTFGLIGAIYGGGPMSYMREAFSYHMIIEIFAILGIILAIATYLIIPEIKSTHDTTVTSDIKEVLSNGRVLCTCLSAGLMVGPMEGFADAWGTTFLKQAYGFDATLAASLPSVIFIGMCFGGPVLSLMAEKMNNYLATIITTGIAMIAIFLFLLLNHPSLGAISFSFALIGICCGYQILAIYKASTYVREEVSGLTTAIANMIIMIFGYVFHTAIGSLINAVGGPTTPEALIYGVFAVPVGLSIGTAGFILLFMLEKKQVVAQSGAV